MPEPPPTSKLISKGGRQTTPAASLSRRASKPRPVPTHGQHLHLLHWTVQPPSTPIPAPHQRLCPMVHWYFPRGPQARKTRLRQATVPGHPSPSSSSVALFPKQGPLQQRPFQPRRSYHDSASHQGAQRCGYTPLLMGRKGEPLDLQRWRLGPQPQDRQAHQQQRYRIRRSHARQGQRSRQRLRERRHSRLEV
ncbi:unnamed protein product, partial [Ectocarpus sp. 12 AP-2014]